MENLAAWSRFVARRVKAPPLTFLNGLRHAVKRGVYCPMHSHRAIEIVYHPAGKGVTRLEKNQVVAFDKGGVVVYAPHELHDQTMETDGDDLCLRMGVPAGEPGVPKKCFYVPAVEDATITEDIRILSRGQARLSPTEQAIFNLRATSTLYALVHLVCGRRDEDDGSSTRKHVLKAEQYLRDHFSTIKTLREVADHIGISYDHLRHAFKDQCGKNPVRYLNEVRMERAKTLLIHSRLPLKQVAAMCGFADEYYFSAVFRNFAGIPPGRYRAKLS
jgi:AraC-like DNA-binding protein